jgi:uncharacterized protein YhaN
VKILDLQLHAFGPFEGTRLDFSRAPGALQVVYGPNEAGKSTCLRAVEALLFGFEHTTRDAHSIPTDKLKIGGRLAGDDGRVLEVVRRKRLKASLRDPDDNVIDEEELRRLFHGVDRPLFRALYGLDHVRLREGARALLDARGGLGESLFEAGLAGAGVAKLAQSLRAEAEALWAPTARKRPLAEALKAYQTAKVDERRMATTATAYQLQEEAIGFARARREEADALVRELALEERRLERTVALAPRLKSRAEALRERAELGEVVLLSDGARAEREAALATRAEASLRLAQAEAQAAGLRAQLGELAEINRPADEIITELAAAIGSVKRDLRTAEALRAERARLAPERGEAEPAVRDELDPRAIVAAVRERDAAELQVATAEGELATARAQLSELERRLGEPEPLAEDLAELEGAVEAAARTAAREQDGKDAERREAKSRAALARARADLGGLATVPDERLAKLEVPNEQEIAAWSKEIERCAASERALVAERVSLEVRRKALERDRSVLLAQGDVPTEAALEAARRVRDERFTRAVTSGADADVEEARDHIRQADALADRLRREIERATRLAALEIELAEVLARGAAIGGEIEIATRAAGAARAACEARFRSAGVAPPPPVELAPAWIGSLRVCLDLWAAAEESSSLARLHAEEEERAAVQLARLLGRPAAEGLAVELARGRAAIESKRDAARRRAADEEARGRARQAEARLVGELAKHEHLQRTARERCRALLASLELAETAPLELVSARLASWQAVRQRSARLSQIDAELASLEQSVAALETSVARIAAGSALSLPEGDVLVRAEAALAALEEARRASSARADVERALAEQVRRADEARERLTQAEAALAALAARASVPVEGLPEAERKSARAQELDRIVQADEQTIAALSDGVPIAELEQQLAGVDLDLAAERLAQIEEEREEADRRKEAATQDMHTKILGLERFDESHAFGHALAAEQHLARARPLFDRYVRLRLAATLLDRQIASYSRLHQGPILARASALFERLTEGSFEGLKVVLDEVDKPELVCIRGGDEVGVDALSDGSRDQLYLALRLATIERHAERAEAMPLVLDDVLVHFDDSRSRAALAALAEIASRVQVLLFTHHARVVELARQAVPAERLGVVELTAARAAARAEL